MKMHFLAAAAALAMTALPAAAAQITLTPGSVVGASSSLGGGFTADNIFDDQSGNVFDNYGSNYWLNTDNANADAFITIDLGDTYALGRFEFFNSRNGGFRDRGTGNFTLVAGNAVASFSGGLRLTGAETVLVSGFLTSSDVEPIAGQSFASLSNAGFRYLEFRPTSVNAPGNAITQTSYALNELRVFEYEAPSGGVPEPATWALMILGFGAAGSALRSRRRPSAA